MYSKVKFIIDDLHIFKSSYDEMSTFLIVSSYELLNERLYCQLIQPKCSKIVYTCANLFSYKQSFFVGKKVRAGIDEMQTFRLTELTLKPFKYMPSISYR